MSFGANSLYSTDSGAAISAAKVLGPSMEQTQTLELYDLAYSDLLLISSGDHHVGPSPSPELSPQELERLDAARRSVMEALGPTGPGLLSISGVPNAAALRRALSLARGLALLDPHRRSLVLKEQELGTDVPLKNPERSVSSFALKLRYESNSDSRRGFGISDARKRIGDDDDDDDDEYSNLGSDLKELGFRMMDIGFRLARVCDAAIGGRELERSLLESSAAKGRLIHYHSRLDRELLWQQIRTKKKMKSDRENQPRVNRAISGASDDEDTFRLWQQWHYDYGIFTVLTAPLFLAQQVIKEEGRFNKSRCEECGYPNGHTLLQVFYPIRKGIFTVRAAPGSFIVQVGESAEVISKGKLRAALHSVAGPPGKLENLSRESFVVFLQPAWDKILCESDYSPLCLDSEERSVQDIEKIVPPLSLRLKGGMTFAQFSRETTKQYYGGSGLQSNR